MMPLSPPCPLWFVRYFLYFSTDKNNTLNNIRLDPCEREALLYSISDIDDEIYITGSRLDPKQKGGDIDLVIFSKQNSLKLSQKIFRHFQMKCEEKIDVLVFDKDNLSTEHKAFLNTLNLRRIK